MKNSAFWGSDKPRMLFSPFIIVKMPTIIVVVILTFMSRKKSCSVELSMKKVYYPGPGAHQLGLILRSMPTANGCVRILKGVVGWCEGTE